MRDKLYISQWCVIRQNRLVMPGRNWVPTEYFHNFDGFIRSLYKEEQVNYPKFYKMDRLSKLGFLCAEMILKDNPVTGRYKKEEIGIVLSNSSSSLDTDLEYFGTIRDKSDYFPSPSVFVYTLPNIVIGEICIRHGIKGENAFLVSERFNPKLLEDYCRILLESGVAKVVLCGWAEVLKDRYDAAFFLAGKDPGDGIQGTEMAGFSADNMNKIYTITGN